MTSASKNTIVTAADAYYFRSLCQFIYTYKRQKEYLNSEMICYDLGFEPDQLARLERLQKKIPTLSVRKFEFEKYPDFVGLSYKTYSFKPLIIREVLQERKGNIFWLDSATILIRPLHNIWAHLDKTGLYTPKGGGGTLERWTVQETLDYMKVPLSLYKKRNVSGGVCGFSYDHADVRQLVEDWAHYALIHECIKPKGADRTNHRDDQSLLTILVYQLVERTGLELTSDEVNISSKNPVGTYSVMNKLKPTFPFGLDFLSVSYFNIYRKIDILVNRYKS